MKNIICCFSECPIYLYHISFLSTFKRLPNTDVTTITWHPRDALNIILGQKATPFSLSTIREVYIWPSKISKFVLGKRCIVLRKCRNKSPIPRLFTILLLARPLVYEQILCIIEFVIYSNNILLVDKSVATVKSVGPPLRTPTSRSLVQLLRTWQNTLAAATVQPEQPPSMTALLFPEH